jgi:DNA-binding beta-propeller fold protein YncE
MIRPSSPRPLAGAAVPALALAALLASGATGLAAQGTTARPTGATTKPAARPANAANAAKPTATYWVYVGAESADLIHRVRFGPDGATVEKTIVAGEHPTEAEGPHGLQISKDGKYLHMTTGHGIPDGKYWRYELGPDTLVGMPIYLGNFPASIDVSPDGLYAYAVNFNLHGEMVPSSVSVIYTPTNTEVAQVTTCTMPHGSRMSPDGTKQYSTCMMDDQLVELDAVGFKVARRFGLAKGKEGPVTVMADAHAGHDMGAPKGAAKMDEKEGHGASMAASCSPTWAQPSVKGDKVYVACNKADEIVEIDVATWTIARRLKTGRGPYNIAVTPDGKTLVSTLKQGGMTQAFDLATGTSLFMEKNSSTVAHGVAISPDSRYAFVTSEGVGAAPGKVDVWDLVAKKKVATADLGQQAGGIAFWKMEARK